MRMEPSTDEPVVHRDNQGRFAITPSRGDEETRYRHRLLVAYVQSLIAATGRAVLSAEEAARVTATPTSLRAALDAVLPVDRPGASDHASDVLQPARTASHWMLWAAGIVALLFIVPATVR